MACPGTEPGWAGPWQSGRGETSCAWGWGRRNLPEHGMWAQEQCTPQSRWSRLLPSAREGMLQQAHLATSWRGRGTEQVRTAPGLLRGRGLAVREEDLPAVGRHPPSFTALQAQLLNPGQGTPGSRRKSLGRASEKPEREVPSANPACAGRWGRQTKRLLQACRPQIGSVEVSDVPAPWSTGDLALGARPWCGAGGTHKSRACTALAPMGAVSSHTLTLEDLVYPPLWPPWRDGGPSCMVVGKTVLESWPGAENWRR